MTNSWNIAKEVAQFVLDDNLEEIQQLLNPCTPEQRKCIMSIKIELSPLLFMAIEQMRVSIVHYFLTKCQADPNATGYRDGDKLTCLAAASCRNYRAIVRILLRYGANTEGLSYSLQTAIFFANTCQGLNIFKDLFKHGANIDHCNNRGDSILMRSIFDLKLLKYLIAKGADVNIKCELGNTTLMLAIRDRREESASVLLSCHGINVRSKNSLGEDAFHLAVRASNHEIAETIIKKGNYTKNEIIKVYQIESCILYTMNKRQKSEELWKKALRLQSQPDDTEMFKNQNLKRKIEENAHDLNADDIPPLFFIESLNGLYDIFKLTVYVNAVKNVKESDRYIRLLKHFLNLLDSFDDSDFFAVYKKIDVFIHYYSKDICSKVSDMLALFELFVTYIEKVRTRLEYMSPQSRMTYARMIHNILYYIIDLLNEISSKCPDSMHLFVEGTRRILKADLRNSRQEFLLQLCVRIYYTSPIVEHLLISGADVNSTDIEGKTVLHEAIEAPIRIRNNIFQMIINNGFDFGNVMYDKYCLPCILDNEDLLPTQAKSSFLKCFAAKVFCENALISFNTVPQYLREVVSSHLCAV